MRYFLQPNNYIAFIRFVRLETEKWRFLMHFRSIHKQLVNQFLFLILIFIFGFSVGCRLGSSGFHITSSESFVVITDIHFTPFYDHELFDALVQAEAEDWAAIFSSSSIKALPSWGQETNYPLLVKTFENAGFAVERDQFIIFLGDILAHKFREQFFALFGSEDEEALRNFVFKTVRFIMLQFRDRFDSAPVFFVLGNNDSYAGDYSLVAGGRFLDDTAELFYDLLLKGNADPTDFFTTYEEGGYYSALPRGEKVMFVCLNTVLFSTHRSLTDEGWKQLEWLEQTLARAEAEGRRIWLLSHIPPGPDIYETVSSYMDETGHISEVELLWNKEYHERFMEITARYQKIIKISFGGHTHMEEYRMSLSNEVEPDMLMIINPAVTPLFGNNPAYRVFTMDAEDWDLLDYRTEAIDLKNHALDYQTLYTFSQAYGFMTPLNGALSELYPELFSDRAKEDSFRRFYYAGHNEASNIKDLNWPAYRCAVGNMNPDGYMDCVNSSY